MFFFTVGFGAFLRKFPWAILIITLISFVWTKGFLVNVRTVNSLLDEKWNKVADLKLKALSTACEKSFKESKSICSSISDTKNLEYDLQKNPKLLDFYLLHKGDLSDWPKASQENTEYNNALTVEKKYHNYRNKLLNDQDFFTIQQRDFLRATRATFTHADWIHFSFNILLLVMLGIWVEQSLGSIRTAIIFLLASYLGLYTEIMVMHTNAILGASAGVMGIVSAFFILFYNKELVLVCTLLGIYWKKITVPTLWVFPFLYLGNDLIALMNINTSGNVAHFAHFIGMLSGALIALAYKKQLQFLPNQYFKYEKKYLHQYSEANNFLEQWDSIKEIIKLNPQNWSLYSDILKTSTHEIENLNKHEQNWLLKHVQFYFSYKLKRSSVPDMIALLKSCSRLYAASSFLINIPLNQVLKLADESVERNEYELANEIYIHALDRVKKIESKIMIEKNITAIKNHLSRDLIIYNNVA